MTFVYFFFKFVNIKLITMNFIKVNELQQCPCFNLRTMARRLTNDYNSALKISGINSTQIPILALINIYDQIETTKIANLLNLESSTIRRNSSLLIKKEIDQDC